MQLSTTWFTEGTIDFELQKYRLLAYLKEVSECFCQSRLYPQLSDILFHYENLVAFRQHKHLMENQFPRRIDDIDLQRAEILYEKMLADDELMETLELITAYAEKKIKSTIATGTELYELVIGQLTIEPIGLLPVYKEEGYFLLRYGNTHEIRAYRYNTTLFEAQSARYHGLKIHYLQSYPHSINHTYTHIKNELVRYYSALHNPAFYSLEMPLLLPLEETILPVARRALIQYLSTS